MPRLSKVDRERAIGMLQVGIPKEEIADRFGCTRRTINRLWSRFNETGTTSDRPRPGRPLAITPREDRLIRLRHLRDRFLSATTTARAIFGRRVCSQTVRNRLRASRLRARRPYTGPVLTQRHRANRLTWSQAHRRWLIRQWNNVTFSDESRFCLTHCDDRVGVWRRRGERFADCCVRQRDRFGGGSVMVWGGICGRNRTRLIVVDGNLNGVRYQDEILRPVVVPFLQRQGVGAIFQQDNAPAHTSRVSRTFLQDSNVEVLDWPSKSPDLSPIEHIWDVLGRRLRGRQNQPANLQELAQALIQEWDNIPANVIRRHTSSMRRRVNAVINANGGHTRY